MADTRLQKALYRSARRLEAMAAELDGVDPDNLSGDDWLRVRARMGDLNADFNEGVADIDRLLGTGGARQRILRYLQLRLGEVVTKDELSGVAGIYEWARRVRELRMDDGWAIHSAVTRPTLGVGDYILELDRPDEELARTWAIARRIRRLRTAGGTPSPRTRVLEFLKAVYPARVDIEQLEYVASPTGSVLLLLGELRDEGWAIVPTPGSEHAGGYGLANPQRQD